jgi:tetratricopeptide (TPR) repeat protein
MERVTLLSPEARIDSQTLARLCLPRAPAATHGAVAPVEAEGQPLDEPARVAQALRQTQGNVVQAARVLGLSRKALRYRMRRYGLARLGDEGQDAGTSVQRDPGDAVVPTSAWEQKPVAVLALEVTWPAAVEPDACPYEPWTVHARWEHTVLEKVQGFGGVVLQRGPSLLLVAFGLPRTLEQLPHRAVQTALGIRQLTAVGPTTGERAPQPTVRQAVHWGQVLVDTGASDPTARVLPIAETLAEPVRLLGQAAPGEILVSTPVRRLVEGWFELQPCAKSVPASTVVGLKPQRSPLALHGQRPLSRFVGRAREFALLAELLGQVAEGRGHVVGMVGEPGVGKSRLLYEFHQQLGAGMTPAPVAQPIRYLEGHCLAYGSAIPYLPVLDLLRSCCGIAPSDSPTATAEKVRLGLQTAGLDPGEGGLYLLPLLGGHTETDRLASLSPELRRTQTFATLRQLLLPGPASPPLVLAVENLHWIDPTSEAFLAALIEGMAGARCLVLTTYRPGYRPPWIEKSYVTQMVLQPLTSQDSRRMLRSLLQTENLLEPLVQMVVTKAQGNPFFLEEIVQTLVEQDVVGQADACGATGSSPCPPTLQLPSTVQEVLAARLDRLPPTEKALLQTLAVIGSAVPWGLLAQVVGQPEEALYQPLGALQAAEFLYEQPAGSERVYRFKHVLTQDVAYASLPRERRRQLHACTAQALEALYADRLEEHYGALAHHYRHSGNTAKAVTYLQRAGEQAMQRSAYAEAVQHLATGAEILRALPDTPKRARQELDMVIALGEAVRMTQGETSPDYERVYFRAHALCQQLGDTPHLFEVLIGLRQYYEVRGQCQRARELAEQIFTLARRLQDPARLAEAHYSLGLTLYYLGELPAARAHFEQRIALYEPRQRGSMVHSLSYVAYILWVLGYPDQALQRIHEALTVAQAWSYPFSVYLALYHAGHIHRLRREVLAAQERNEAAVALAAELGLARRLPMTVHQRGWVLAAQGRGAEGIAQMREGLSTLQATGAELAQPRLLALLAEAYGHGGQAEAGLRVVADALAVAHRTGERRDEAEICRVKGELLLQHAVANAPEAEACFQQALAMARRQQAKSWELRAAMSLARLWQQQGKRAQARELLAPLYDWFTEGFDTADLQDARVLLDTLI